MLNKYRMYIDFETPDRLTVIQAVELSTTVKNAVNLKLHQTGIIYDLKLNVKYNPVFSRYLPL